MISFQIPSNVNIHSIGLSTFNVFITNCKFMKTQVAFAIFQNSHSPVSRTQSSRLVINDSDFLNNTVSFLVVIFQGALH